MMVIGEQFKFSVVKAQDIDTKQIKSAGLFIDIVNGQVEIILNSNKAYRVLSNKDIIVGGLNKKLSEMIQMKLDRMAKDEEALENGK